MSDTLCDMGKITVSVRELQQNLMAVMSRVERGETVEVTRHRRPVMRLTRIRPTAPAQPWPDPGSSNPRRVRQPGPAHRRRGHRRSESWRAMTTVLKTTAYTPAAR